MKNKRVNKGVFQYIEGITYQGEWKNDKVQKVGNYLNSQNEEMYSGPFIDVKQLY